MLDKTVSGKTPETFLYDSGRNRTYAPTMPGALLLAACLGGYVGFLPDDVKFR